MRLIQEANLDKYLMLYLIQEGDKRYLRLVWFCDLDKYMENVIYGKPLVKIFEVMECQIITILDVEFVSHLCFSSIEEMLWCLKYLMLPELWADY